MADDLGMDQYDDPTILGLLEKGPRGYRVISVQDHGNGDLDPFCRENIVKRAIRTRLTDQEIAYVFGRGGDTVYLVMNTGEPDTYEVGKGQWVLGEEVPEAQGVEQLRALKVEGTNTNLLTNEQIEAIVQGQEAPGLKKVLMKDRDKYIEKYFVEINNREGYMTSRYISTKKTETRFDLNAQGNLEVRLRDAEKALETPELSAATMQAERRNHHMVSVLRAQRKLRNLHRKRRKQRSELVEYPMTGCSPKGRPEDDNDRRGWRDAEYRSAIRQRRGKKDPFGLRQKRGRDLPLGLYYRNERYMVRIGNLDIDGLRVLAHNEAERESRTSKEAYEQLMEALVHKMVRGNEEEQLQACEIMARYGENGLRTGSNQFYQEIFGLREGHREGSDSFWIYPDQQARGRAWQRPHDPNGGYAYEPLYRRMQRVLHAAYHKDPAVTPVDEYNPFWTEKEFENRYGQTWYTIDLQDPNKRHAHKAALDLQEDFIAANFDRTMPSEQYRFRKTLSQLFGAHDKKSYRSKSRALRRVMELTIHIISLPTVSWHYEPDGKGGGEWKLEIDWSTFDYFAEGIEAFRDWVRMIAEWQQTKAMLNAYAAMSFTRQIADQGRTRDFGGIWNSVPIWQCWAYRLLYWYANSRPSVLDEHGMPQFDASGNRLWKRRAPMPIQPTRERPKRLPGETWGSGRLVSLCGKAGILMRRRAQHVIPMRTTSAGWDACVTTRGNSKSGVRRLTKTSPKTSMSTRKP